jgi:hypothetical protein
VGKVYEAIDERLADWIMAQPMFFVGTAPSGAGGHINISPKGPIETFKILDGHTAAYLDLVGSGAETVAHIRENGRIVIMLCAFEGPPLILRLHGRGSVVQQGDPQFESAAGAFELPETVAGGPARRAVVTVQVDRIADSCGYGVPVMEPVAVRPQQAAWVDRKLRQGDRALVEYMAEKNSSSLDGLAAIDIERLG